MKSMLGFPKEFAEPFYSAWTEPFTGFELKWIEVEICRQAIVPTNISDLFDKMKARYLDLKDMHQSKFYRIIASLVKDGYLEDTPDGRSKIIKTKPAGMREFGRIARYFFEIQIEQFKGALWHDMIEKITDTTGCLLEQKCLVLGPEYHAVNILIKECATCNTRGDLPLKANLSEYQSNFSFLDYHAIINNKTTNSSIWQLQTIDDWAFKENYFDCVILLTSLMSHQDKAIDILNEAKRVVKEDGHVILFEITKEDSNFVGTLMREATKLLNFSNANEAWILPSELPDRDTLVDNWIAKSTLSIVEEYPDIISSVFVLS